MDPLCTSNDLHNFFFGFVSLFPHHCVCMRMSVKPFLTPVMADAGSWRELPRWPGGRVGMWRPREPQWDKDIYTARSLNFGKATQNVSADVSPGADLSFSFHLHVFGFFLSCCGACGCKEVEGGWGYVGLRISARERKTCLCIPKLAIWRGIFSNVSSFFQAVKNILDSEWL